MLNRLIGKVALRLGVSRALGFIRDCAEGKNGPDWKARYWRVAGAKRWIGFVLMLFAIGSEAAGFAPRVSLALGGVSLFLLSAGFVDKSWRSDVPQVVRDSATFRVLAKFSGELAALLASAAYFISTGECGGWDCAILARVLAAVAAILVHLGLVDAAWRSVPPIFRTVDGRYVITFGKPPSFGDLDSIQPPRPTREVLPAKSLQAHTREEVEEVWRRLIP